MSAREPIGAHIALRNRGSRCNKIGLYYIDSAECLPLFLGLVTRNSPLQQTVNCRRLDCHVISLGSPPQSFVTCKVR